MPDEKNFFAGLVDFSFQQQLLRRLVKVLYIIGILGVAIWVVIHAVIGFQESSADGLINLGVGLSSWAFSSGVDCSSWHYSFSASRTVLTARHTPDESAAKRNDIRRRFLSRSGTRAGGVAVSMAAGHFARGA